MKAYDVHELKGIDPRQIAVLRRLDDELDIGVTYAGWCILNLPHRRLAQPNLTWRRELRRADFTCQLIIEPGELQVGTKTTLFGVPYGSTARIILLYLQSEAIRTQSREIELGPSFSAWLKRLGIPIGGKTYKAAYEQLMRISACSLRFLWGGRDDRGLPMNGFHKDSIITTGAIGFDIHEVFGQQRLWQERIVLGETFFQELKKRPVPVNVNAVRAIMHSSRATDLYVWLTYRTFGLNRPIKIGWLALREQFGEPKNRLDRFRDRFNDALKLALTVYSECRVEVDLRKGLTVHPSPPAVPERRCLRVVSPSSTDIANSAERLE